MHENVNPWYKNMRFWFIAILVVVIIAGAIVATVMLTRKGDGMTVVALAGNDIEQNRAADYKKSRLYLHGNGTFTVSVTHRNANVFVGIGTYKKEGDKYIFTYHDMWRVEGTEIKRDFANKNRTFTYATTKNGRIELMDPNHQIYYFK